MKRIVPGFDKQITEEMAFRVASTPQEGEFLAQFNAEIHGEGLDEYVIRMYNEHPNKNEILWMYIEDITLEQENKIVSSAAMLPLQWQIGKTRLKVAEMGFVGTHPDYRGQSLFGVINDLYEEALKERDITISALVGIPHYYSRFGYIFSLNRLSGYFMPVVNIPSDTVEEVKIRKATEEDIPTVAKFYEETNSKYAVFSVFNKEAMIYRLMNGTADLFNSMTYIVEENRKPRGFFCLGSFDNSDRADIMLTSDLTHAQMIKTLQFVKNYNPGAVNAFKVNVLPSSQFGKYLHLNGADPFSDWLWQVKIPDIHQFFKAITPVLEERVENSIFRGLSRPVVISNYTISLTLNFEDGKITDIASVKEFPGRGVDLRIPSPYMVRLFFSDRSIDEIKHIITDTLVKSESKMLLETLFPRIESIPFSWYE
ncbi:MAG: GNAT family N-acetyltransferase [Candidatus Kariarchaeaceae archaeon]|jgi:hypothetical protein